METQTDLNRDTMVTHGIPITRQTTMVTGINIFSMQFTNRNQSFSIWHGDGNSDGVDDSLTETEW
jgi:hypothetical protein